MTVTESTLNTNPGILTQSIPAGNGAHALVSGETVKAIIVASGALEGVRIGLCTGDPDDTRHNCRRNNHYYPQDSGRWSRTQTCQPAVHTW